jgi:hypothetical protein
LPNGTIYGASQHVTRNFTTLTTFPGVLGPRSEEYAVPNTPENRKKKEKKRKGIEKK